MRSVPVGLGFCTEWSPEETLEQGRSDWSSHTSIPVVTLQSARSHLLVPVGTIHRPLEAAGLRLLLLRMGAVLPASLLTHSFKRREKPLSKPRGRSRCQMFRFQNLKQKCVRLGQAMLLPSRNGAVVPSTAGTQRHRSHTGQPPLTGCGGPATSQNCSFQLHRDSPPPPPPPMQRLLVPWPRGVRQDGVQTSLHLCSWPSSAAATIWDFLSPLEAVHPESGKRGPEVGFEWSPRSFPAVIFDVLYL